MVTRRFLMLALNRFYRRPLVLILCYFILILYSMGQTTEPEVIMRAVGTGRTTGHIADLFIMNTSDRAVEVEIGPMFIPGKGNTQGYLVDGESTAKVPPMNDIPFPLYGYCTHIDRAPAQSGTSLPPVSEWIIWTEGAPIPMIGTALPSSFQPRASGESLLTWPGTAVPFEYTLNFNDNPREGVRLLVHFITSITQTTDLLIREGSLRLSDLEREAIIQQTFWMFTSQLEGKNYNLNQFQELYFNQWREAKNAADEEVPSAVMEDVTNMWASISLVGEQAKVLEVHQSHYKTAFQKTSIGEPVNRKQVITDHLNKIEKNRGSGEMVPASMMYFLYAHREDAAWATLWRKALSAWRNALTTEINAINPVTAEALSELLLFKSIMDGEGQIFLSTSELNYYNNLTNQKLNDHIHFRLTSLSGQDMHYIEKWRTLRSWQDATWYTECCGKSHPLSDLPATIPKSLVRNPMPRPVSLTGPGWKIASPPIIGTPSQFPWWIPAVVVPVGGVATWLILRDKSKPDQPGDPPLPIATTDHVNIQCGSFLITDILVNDTGAGIFISNVQTVQGVEITIVNTRQVRIETSSAAVYSVTYTITDSLGRTATADINIIVTDDQPPTISCPPDFHASSSAETHPSVAGFASFGDNCTPHDQLLSSWQDAIMGGDCKNIDRLWSVTDLQGLSTSCTQSIYLPDEVPPTIQCPVDASIPVSASSDPTVTGQPQAADNCASQTEIQVIYSDVTDGEGCQQTIQRTWTATDLYGNVSTCLQTISRVDSAPPGITCPPDTAISCTVLSDIQSAGVATAVDDCTTDVPVNYNDPNTFSGCGQSMTRIWTATDEKGNTATCVQILDVRNEEPPAYSECPTAVTVELGQQNDLAITGLAKAENQCDPALNVSVTYEDDLSQFTDCGGIIERRWTAQDDCGNSNTQCLQQITVVNAQPPKISCPGQVKVGCGQQSDIAVTGSAQAEDACGAPLTATYSDDPPIVEGCIGTITRTWTASDGGGQSTSCTQQIDWEDVLAPVFTVCPPPVTVPCSVYEDLSVTGIAVAEDNCQANIEPTWVDDLSGYNGCAGIVLRSFHAVDICGNESMCVQEIMVFDNTPPVMVCPPPITVQCGQQNNLAVTGMAIANDDCGIIVELNHIDNVDAFAACEGMIIRSFFAIDQCGNVVTCQQTIHVVNLPCPFTPTFAVEADVCLNCTGAVDVAIMPPGEYIIEWSNGESGPSVSGLCTGSYSVTITNIDMGCSDIYYVEVPNTEEIQLVVQQVIPPSAPSNNDGSIILEVTTPGAQLPYLVFLNGVPIGTAFTNPFQIFNLMMGEYVIQIQENNGQGCFSNEVFVLLFSGGKPHPLIAAGTPQFATKESMQIQLPSDWQEHPVPPGTTHEIELSPVWSGGQTLLLPFSNQWNLRMEVVNTMGAANLKTDYIQDLLGRFNADRFTLGVQRQWTPLRSVSFFGEGLAGIQQIRAVIDGIAFKDQQALLSLNGGMQWLIPHGYRLEVSSRLSVVLSDSRPQGRWQVGAQLLIPISFPKHGKKSVQSASRGMQPPLLNPMSLIGILPK